MENLFYTDIERDQRAFITAERSEKGVRKRVNQDSLLVIEAQTAVGETLFAALCDGVGGLSRGEDASYAMVTAFGRWFEESFPEIAVQMAEGSFSENRIREQWNALIQDSCMAIGDYGRRKGISLGTTAVAALLAGGNYFIMNVGDSRVYLLTDHICQLTKDHTYVQQEIDAGRMTEEESLSEPGRNILLQCIGAGPPACPSFISGRLMEGQVFLLCSDGFRNKISPEEIYKAFRPYCMVSVKAIEQSLSEMIERNRSRGEEDDISAVLAAVRRVPFSM